MERIDKIISSQGEYSRSEVKKMILQKRIKVNNEIIKNSDLKIDTDTTEIKIDNKKITIKKNIYLILNKPQGYISATEDRKELTVLELVPKELYRKTLFPAGRLDKDTTGLMIITDDGVLSHNILSPKKHIKKIYEVTLDIPITKEMVTRFFNGIELNDGKCMPGKLEITGEYTGLVTIKEGRYHQIKRMFGVCGAKVIKLNRICMGNLLLPDNLKLGECRELTNKELLELQEKNV